MAIVAALAAKVDVVKLLKEMFPLPLLVVELVIVLGPAAPVAPAGPATVESAPAGPCGPDIIVS